MFCFLLQKEYIFTVEKHEGKEKLPQATPVNILGGMCVCVYVCVYTICFYFSFGDREQKCHWNQSSSSELLGEDFIHTLSSVTLRVRPVLRGVKSLLGEAEHQKPILAQGDQVLMVGRERTKKVQERRSLCLGSCGSLQRGSDTEPDI